MSILRNLKNKLYFFIAEKNVNVRNDYDWYVSSNLDEHNKHPWKHRILLLKLNWHYRVKKSSQPYFNMPKSPNKTNKAGAQSSLLLGKPESKKRNWQDAYHYAQSLLKYDVISFDIFDTLILRKLNTPTDLFYLIGGKYEMIDFHNLRKKAEQEARDIKEQKEGNREISIDDIYEQLSRYIGPKLDEIKEDEFAIELDMCYANPYFHLIYQILITMGKTVVATSDMYFPKAIMKTLLDNCGYEKLSEIYVSCDYECNKVNGGLYELLQDTYGADKKIIHIGDNFASDVLKARECGLEAHHYVACRGLGNPHRSLKMSPLIESAYRAVINNTLHNGLMGYSRVWEYGFVYGGLATLGYVHWIHRQARKSGVTKLLFLARDGFVLKKAFDLLFDDIETEYVYWSRSAAVRSALTEEKYYFLEHFLFRRKNTGETIQDALEVCGVNNFAHVFQNMAISLDTEITDDNIDFLLNVLLEHWSELEQCLLISQKCMKAYITCCLDNHEHVGIVDLGFSGHNTLILKSLIEKICNTQVEMYLMGSSLGFQNAELLLNKTIKCYMFDCVNNPGIRDEVNAHGYFACGLFERMYGAPHPSFMGYTNEGNMEFAPVEAENNELLVELQKGILSFCEQYQDWFSKYPELFEISGWDAYRPIALLETNKIYVQETIGDLVQVFRVTNKKTIALSDL